MEKAVAAAELKQMLSVQFDRPRYTLQSGPRPGPGPLEKVDPGLFQKTRNLCHNLLYRLKLPLRRI